MKPQIKIGMSAAASWAWGTSLIVGMQIAQQKGLAAWTIWAIANSVTLAVFGELARKGILGRNVFNLAPVKWAALVIQGFCLIIQMNIIFEVLQKFGLGWWESYGAASGTGIVFTLWMYRHGLITSIKTDICQWMIAMLAIIGIIGTGLYSGVPYTSFPASTSSDVLWGVWSACILLSGPIGDVQHWQRVEADSSGKAYRYGALFFALYMGMILVMACFQFTPVMNGILLVAVLCVTSSTIDSIAVAMHEISSKQAGTGAAVFICLFWGVFAQFGVLSLWSHAGIYRVGFALLILALAWTKKAASIPSKSSAALKHPEKSGRAAP